MKKIKGLLMALMAIALIMGMIPMSVMAVESHDNQVRVVVENNTYTKADGAPWEGTLVDEWVDINQDSTMMSAVQAALAKNNYSQIGAESNYISEINGLAAFDGGSASGWMGTLNDWFTNSGFADFTVKAGKLEAGDIIDIAYSCNYGEDLGGSWGNNNKALKALSTNVGTLSPTFSGTTKDYTLTLEKGINSVVVTPTAANKNFQVRSFVGSTEYKRSAGVPVENGTVITVTDGDPSWPTMNEASRVPAETYTITVKYTNTAPTRAKGVDAAVTQKVMADTRYQVDLSTIFTDKDKDTLTYKVSINGEEAVDAAVNYSYKPADGDVLIFTANDGYEDSTDTYQVTIEASNNQAPVIKEGVLHFDTAELYAKYFYADGSYHNGTYKSYTMSSIFEDPDKDSMTYWSKEDDGEWTRKYASVYYYPQTAGIHTLQLKANDGEADSEIFTLTVNAIAQVPVSVTAEKGTPIFDRTGYKGQYLYVWDAAKDNQIQLKAAVDTDGDDTVTWSSSDKGCTIDANGLVTLVKPNYSTSYSLKATANKDGYSESQWFTIYVIPNQVTIGLDTKDITLPEDGNITTTTISLPNSDYNGLLKIENSDASVAVAEISSNKLNITPVKPGTTTVKLSYTNDPTNYDEVTINVSGVRVTRADGSDSKYFTLQKGSTPSTLALKAQGLTDGETFTWTSSDVTVATVDEKGVVTGIKDGPVIIYATSSESSLLNTVKGGISLEIAGEGVPYMDNLSLSSYSSFGWTSGSAGFHATQLEYNLTSTNAGLASFMFTPTYDGDKYTGKAYYKDSTRQETSTAINPGVSNTLNYALYPGDNTIKIVLSDKTEANNTTTYTFKVNRPYTATKTITGMTVQPDGTAAQTYPTYKGKAEGTLFKSPGGVVGTFTGWSSSTSEYTTYAFANTKEMALTPTFGDAFEHVRVSVDGGTATELMADVSSKKPDTQSYGVKADGTTLVYEVISSQIWADRMAAGTQDPWSEGAENTYIIKIEQVTANGADMKITSAQLSEGAAFFGTGFVSTDFAPNILINRGITSVDMRFTVPNGYEVYNGSKSDAKKLTGTAGEKETTYQLTMATPLTTSGTAATIILYDASSNVQYSYKFAYTAKGEEGVQPSRVVDYLCLGSQYTNSASYGMLPEKTLQYGGSLKSLGNFGGYITYEFDTPITNDPTNPNGIDFIAFGNCFAEQQSAAEPGWVQVSSDGVNWYYLAGSTYYDDEADWNYSMTYTKTASGASSWTASDGTSGTNYTYPLVGNYPLHTFAPGEENSMTVSGLHLVANAKDPYGSASAAYPDFGYVDTHMNNTVKGEATNPYLGSGNSKDGMFDLDWAVDAEGKPVSVDNVKYIKVGTASNIYAGVIGEKSTEITSIYTTQNKAEEAVGQTAAPTGITVDGTALALKEGTTSYRAAVDGDFDVTVDAPEGANVYINGNRGTTRTYESTPLHNTLRIIVQEGEKEASITYITLITPEEAALEEVQGMLSGLKPAEEITLEDEEQLIVVRKAYDALTDEAKAKISAEDVKRLTDDEARLAQLKADVAAAEKVTTKINGLPDTQDLTIAYLVPVQDARTAYDALSDAQKALVLEDTLKHLTDAEKKMAELSAEAALNKQKDEAKAELKGYVDKKDYREAQQTEIDKAIEKGSQAIDKATDKDGIDQALTNAKTAMDAIKTDAKLTAEELATAKTEAKAELQKLNQPEKYRDAEKAALAQAIKDGEAAIDAAADQAAVTSALESAKTTIGAIKTDADYDLEEAATLDAAKKAAGEVLDQYKKADDYREAQQAELAKTIADAKAAIAGITVKDNDVNAAVSEVQAQVVQAKTTMDAIKTDAQLAAEEDQAAAQVLLEKIALAEGKIADNNGGVADAMEAVNDGYDALSTGAKALVKDAVDKVNAAAKALADQNHQSEMNGGTATATDADGKDLPVDTKITTSNDVAADSITKAENAAGELSTVLSVNIKMEGTPVDGGIKITLPVDLSGYNTSSVKVVHIKDNGTIEILEAVYDEDAKTVTFTVDNFSDFVVLAKKIEVPIPGTSDEPTADSSTDSITEKTDTTGITATVGSSNQKTGINGDAAGILTAVLLLGLAGSIAIGYRKREQ